MTKFILHDIRKKLAFRFVLENVNYKERCACLQEIIKLSRLDDLWRKALVTFFDTPVQAFVPSVCRN